MPAITYGHSYFDLYTETINRLRKAASQSSGALRVICYYGYLNEIVSHRRLAIAEIEKWGDEFRDGIVKQAVYYGTANMNVFVGAYANLLQRQKELEFTEFLQKYAPYSTESELSDWLKKQGILVQRDAEMKTSEFAAISLDLQKSYASAIAAGKDVQLIEHDAVQLSTLHRDRLSGRRSILVTADKRLENRLSPVLPHQTVRAVFPHTAFRLVNVLFDHDLEKSKHAAPDLPPPGASLLPFRKKHLH